MKIFLNYYIMLPPPHFVVLTALPVRGYYNDYEKALQSQMSNILFPPFLIVTFAKYGIIFLSLCILANCLPYLFPYWYPSFATNACLVSCSIHILNLFLFLINECQSCTFC